MNDNLPLLMHLERNPWLYGLRTLSILVFCRCYPAWFIDACSTCAHQGLCLYNDHTTGDLSSCSLVESATVLRRTHLSIIICFDK